MVYPDIYGSIHNCQRNFYNAGLFWSPSTCFLVPLVFLVYQDHKSFMKNFVWGSNAQARTLVKRLCIQLTPAVFLHQM